MTRIRFLVAYDGTDYCGWQRQNHGPKKSVAHTIEDALKVLLNEEIGLFASGRTDAGVHAIAQVCHFDTQKPVEHFAKWDLAWALKSRLPESISVKKVWLAPDDFHSTISSTHKTYKYFIYNHHRRSPFLARYADWVRHPLNLDHLNASAQYIIGKHDFKSFQSVGTIVPHTVREVYKAQWAQRSRDMVQFSITGSGFLKQMVRNIVGTQLMLEKKGEDPSKMQEILLAQDRKIAGPPAPPQGLFLWRVYYPKDLDIRCRPL